MLGHVERVHPALDEDFELIGVFAGKLLGMLRRVGGDGGKLPGRGQDAESWRSVSQGAVGGELPGRRHDAIEESS
jgi:hypothetical protein